MAASTSENDLKTQIPSSNEAEQPQIQAIRMPSMEEIRAQDVWNNCAVRSAASGVMGGGLGFMMGMFLGALDNPIMQEQMSGRQQLIYNLKQMGTRSWSSAKTFAGKATLITIGGLVAGAVVGSAVENWLSIMFLSFLG
ncbi:hypothetical protein HRI_002156400 [Hibiscus trionum]|uniref:Mitochondrial import inner membrane translocase subunit TIM22 n=1 Tax=Hibiscus trionum TaxID=183268 RepID=A0A9W7HWX1_HIBTR|nr:hypothetical protein HRI_002156400 [Hibiscus trionum]